MKNSFPETYQLNQIVEAISQILTSDSFYYWIITELESHFQPSGIYSPNSTNLIVIPFYRAVKTFLEDSLQPYFKLTYHFIEGVSVPLGLTKFYTLYCLGIYILLKDAIGNLNLEPKLRDWDRPSYYTAESSFFGEEYYHKLVYPICNNISEGVFITCTREKELGYNLILLNKLKIYKKVIVPFVQQYNIDGKEYVY